MFLIKQVYFEVAGSHGKCLAWACCISGAADPFCQLGHACARIAQVLLACLARHSHFANSLAAILLLSGQVCMPPPNVWYQQQACANCHLMYMVRKVMLYRETLLKRKNGYLVLCLNTKLLCRWRAFLFRAFLTGLGGSSTCPSSTMATTPS